MYNVPWPFWVQILVLILIYFVVSAVEMVFIDFFTYHDVSLSRFRFYKRIALVALCLTFVFEMRVYGFDLWYLWVAGVIWVVSYLVAANDIELFNDVGGWKDTSHSHRPSYWLLLIFISPFALVWYLYKSRMGLIMDLIRQKPLKTWI